MRIKGSVQIFVASALFFLLSPLYAEGFFQETESLVQDAKNDLQCFSYTATMAACDIAIAKEIRKKYSGNPKIEQCKLYEKSSSHLVYEFYVKPNMQFISCERAGSSSCRLSDCNIAAE